MKKLLLFVAAAFTMSSAVTAQATAQTKAEDFVKFHELKYDFGKIKQGVPTTFDFEFKNITDKPLVVESASASCGCTTPKWPQTPVMAGKKEKINVGYNAAGAGAFSKTITVWKTFDHPVMERFFYTRPLSAPPPPPPPHPSHPSHPVKNILALL